MPDLEPEGPFRLGMGHFKKAGNNSGHNSGNNSGNWISIQPGEHFSPGVRRLETRTQGTQEGLGIPACLRRLSPASQRFMDRRAGPRRWGMAGEGLLGCFKLPSWTNQRKAPGPGVGAVGSSGGLIGGNLLSTTQPENGLDFKKSLPRVGTGRTVSSNGPSGVTIWPWTGPEIVFTCTIVCRLASLWRFQVSP